MTLIVPPRRVSQRLHPDKGLLKTSNQNHPPRSSPPLPKDQNIQPSVISLKSSYTSQPTTCPPLLRVPAKTAEVLARPKPMEAPLNNHPHGHPRQYKSFKEMRSSNRSNCKTRRKKTSETRLLKRRSCSKSNRRSRGSIKNRNPS
jgi:hypothetical protein